MATIKDILNNVLAESGFLKRDQFFGSPDPDDIQMGAIANRVAYEIFNFYDWNQIRKSDTILLQVGQELYDLPADYQSFVPDSAWETDGSRKVDVPVSDQEWYQYRYSSLTSGGVIRARFMGDKLFVVEPFAGGSISFSYVSKYVIKADTGNLQEFFTNDLDTWLLDDQVLTLGIQAHWQQTKMMPTYKEHMGNYMIKMNEAISRANSGSTIGGIPSPIRKAPYTKLWVN